MPCIITPMAAFLLQSPLCDNNLGRGPSPLLTYLGTALKARATKEPFTKFRRFLKHVQPRRLAARLITYLRPPEAGSYSLGPLVSAASRTFILFTCYSQVAHPNGSTASSRLISGAYPEAPCLGVRLVQFNARASTTPILSRTYVLDQIYP